MIASLDHLVLTVRDLNTSAAFYQRVLGMQLEIFGEGRMPRHFGAQKINLHPADGPYAPHATAPLPGSADLCFLSDWPLDQVLNHLDQTGIAIEQGPVRRSGANGPILSVYIRDPDGNLLEIAQPLAD